MRFPDYPFESRFFEHRGIRLHYVDEGPRDAPPVVMVHGNPTWSFYYRHLIAALRERHRVIAPDHVGMGLSDKPDDDRYEYTLARRVDDLAALLAHVGAENNVTLVLHDWGGMIGSAYAVERPERIARLVLLNTAAFQLPPGKRFPWQLAACRTRLLGPPLVRGLNLFCRGALRDCVVRRPLPADVCRAYLAPYDSWANRRAILRFVQDIPIKAGDRAYGLVERVAQRLELLRGVPTLICWGARDFVFDDHFLAEWRTRLPQAEVHRLADAGHYVLEDAADEIVPLVQDFFQRHPLGAAAASQPTQPT